MDGPTLPAACRSVFDAAGQAIDWIGRTRAEAPRLDREGDALVLQLRRTRNDTRRLENAARRPLAMGFFGESQVGKSYLVSVLAAGADGKLETQLGADRLDFLAHVNPVGHGKEATGLVTRFTCRKGDAPASHPIEVRLLSEADIVKILGNSYFRDFNQELAPQVKDEDIAQRLAEMRARARPEPTGGLSADDVVDVMDYFLRHFRKSMERYARFWHDAVTLAPRLDIEDRARFLGLLWQDLGPLTDCYRNLAGALSKIGHAEEAACALSALVEKKDGGYAKEKGIINVQTLWQLGRDTGDQVALLPRKGGALLPEVTLPRSVLAGLVAELKFVLAAKPSAGLVETVDLLDFPGYRGRLAATGLDDVGKQAKSAANADPVAELFLRGKVAYLFERYTDEQEMNLLLLCVASSRQPEVAAVKDAVSAWVRQTQGASVAERSRRNPGLFFVVTRFDEKLAPMGSAETAESRRLMWSDLMKMVLEKVGNEDWVQDWNGRPFRNTFLMRKPRLANAIIDLSADERETGYKDKARLDDLRGHFVAEPLVQAHVGEADQAWDAVVKLDDGGAARLIAKLSAAADPALKLGRVHELLVAGARRIRDGIGSFYSGVGSEEVARKTEAFDKLLGDLSPDFLGRILGCLQPAPERLRALYFGAGERAEAAPAIRAQRSRVDLSALMSSGGAARPAAPQGRSARAEDFAAMVMGEWRDQLRQFPEEEALLRHLGPLPREHALFVTRELLTAASAQKLQERVMRAIEAAEANAGAQWEAMVDRQVLTAAMAVNRFVDYLGQLDHPEPQRVQRPDGTPVFADPPPAGAYPELGEEESPVTLVLDWLLAFKAAAIENAGHSEASEIPAAANQKLGEILARLPAS